MNIFEKYSKWMIGLAIVIPAILIAIDICTSKEWSKYWPPIGTSFIFLVAYFAYILNKKLKQIDVQMKCQERYEKLQFDVLPSVEDRIGKENAYYQRYWSLQFEQFQYYIGGFISDQIYLSWLRFRKMNAESNATVGNESYNDAWARIRESYLETDKRFVALIDSAHNGSIPSDAKQLKGYINSLHRNPVNETVDKTV